MPPVLAAGLVAALLLLASSGWVKAQSAPAPPVQLDAHDQALSPLASDVRTSFALDVPDPNPFTQFTRVSVQMPLRKHIRLLVVDRDGRVVQVLYQGELPAGRHTFVFDPDDTLSEGIYRIVFKTPGRSFTEPIKLLR